MSPETQYGSMDRRTFLGVAGSAALAATATAPVGAVDEGEIDDWLSDTPNYDGSVADMTGSEEVTITVGAGDGFAYDPPAVRVSSGTTVVWEWSGNGGSHDVSSEDGAFGSERQDAEGATFKHQFEESGFFPYKCTPHASMGMKGAVIVAEEGATVEESSDDTASADSSASTAGIAGMATMGLMVLLSPFALWLRQSLADDDSSANGR
ncbi:halocyanin domain-containing protein [Saliphagus infecundisoli]|uniref:Halocyanin domain-containing protein n=1 Tax=Saliphagus infecundisoli TaxID=1849069 RepID=A0ABD5QCF2_9EURY|nr:halocyanin domain-containing protein [Saliphagus infecundisoli]